MLLVLNTSLQLHLKTGCTYWAPSIQNAHLTRTPHCQYTITATANREHACALWQLLICLPKSSRAKLFWFSSATIVLDRTKTEARKQSGLRPSQFITHQLGHGNYSDALHRANPDVATWLTSVPLGLTEVVLSWLVLSRGLYGDVSCTQMSDSDLSSYGKSIFRSLLSKHPQRLNAFWQQTWKNPLHLLWVLLENWDCEKENILSKSTDFKYEFSTARAVHLALQRYIQELLADCKSRHIFFYFKVKNFITFQILAMQ